MEAETELSQHPVTNGTETAQESYETVADTEASSSFPSIEIKCAETISEDAFEEEKTVAEDTNGDLFNDYDTEQSTVLDSEDNVVTNGDTSDNAKDSEDGQSMKDQEPVNENTEAEGGETCEEATVSPVKKENDDGDEPNEDPNRDTADSDQEMDPEIAAAMEASLLETEQMDEEQEAAGDDDDKEPMFRFCNETEVDSATEENDVDMAPAEDAISAADEELTLEGEAVTGEMGIEVGTSIPITNPLEGNPLDDEQDPGDYDPLVEDGFGIAVDEDTNGFLDQVNNGFMTTIHSFPEKKTRGPRGPYKKKGDNVDADADYDPLSPAPFKAKKSSEVLQCSLCYFPFESIGQLKHHKYTDHENQPKPNYLDLVEVYISAAKKGKSMGKILSVSVFCIHTGCPQKMVPCCNESQQHGTFFGTPGIHLAHLFRAFV